MEGTRTCWSSCWGEYLWPWTLLWTCRTSRCYTCPQAKGIWGSWLSSCARVWRWTLGTLINPASWAVRWMKPNTAAVVRAFWLPAPMCTPIANGAVRYCLFPISPPTRAKPNNSDPVIGALMSGAGDPHEGSNPGVVPWRNRLRWTSPTPSQRW